MKLSKIVRNLLKTSKGFATSIKYMASSGSSKIESVDPKLIAEWRALQEDLRFKIIKQDVEEWQKDLSKLKLVGALDISYPVQAHDQSICDAYAALVICNFPEMTIAYENVEHFISDTPYVPGYLAFRELSPLLSMISKLLEDRPELKPDVLLVDGNGTLHPQQAGIACHIGISTDIVSIGVAKNIFLMEHVDCTKAQVQNMGAVGDFMEIKDRDGTILGLALKSAENAKNPIYVSVGHKISLETARKTVLACCKVRNPEPLRFADHISREFIRKLETPKKELNKI